MLPTLLTRSARRTTHRREFKDFCFFFIQPLFSWTEAVHIPRMSSESENLPRQTENDDLIGLKIGSNSQNSTQKDEQASNPQETMSSDPIQPETDPADSNEPSEKPANSDQTESLPEKCTPDLPPRRRSASENMAGDDCSIPDEEAPPVPSDVVEKVSTSHWQCSKSLLDGGNKPDSNFRTPSPFETESIGSGGELDAEIALGLSLSHSPSEGSTLSKVLIDDPAVLLKSPEGQSLLPSSGCEMCANYEIYLQKAQETERSLKQQLTSAQHLADRYRTELSDERLYRGDLESKMTKLSSETAEKLGKLEKCVSKLEKSSEYAENLYKQRLLATKEKFKSISKSRESVCDQMAKLRAQYDKLLGKHRQQADTMQRECIDLPQSVDELQEACLGLREELIETRAAKEHLEDSLKSENLFLKEQLTGETQAKEQLEENLMEEVNNLRTELGISQSTISDLQERNKRTQELERQITEYQTTVGDLETKLQSLQTDKGELDFANLEYKKKTLALQQELDNCEAVQRDFVKLSQSLQIELEKIRQAEMEVRWQDPEDAVLCNGSCKQPFTKTRLKQHCRHCGKIFCADCLSKTVPSGPQRRSAKVCEVCYTLLVRDSAPYFSEHVPNNV